MYEYKQSKNKSLIVSEEIEGLPYTPFMVDIKIYDHGKIVDQYQENHFKFVNSSKKGNIQIDVFEHDNIIIERYLIFVGGCFKTYCKLINKSKRELKLCGLSSLSLFGIFKEISSQNTENLLVHYYKSGWCCEGQETISNINDLYFPIVNDRYSELYHDFVSETSTTTKTYLPIFIFENKNNGESLFVNPEPRGRWQLRLSYATPFKSNLRTLQVNTFTGTNSTCDFFVRVKPGETYETFITSFGYAPSFNQTLKMLNDMKREGAKQPNNYIVFNDYMNCLWATPNLENTIPLVDKAHEVGADIYCMDSGWFRSAPEVNWASNFGDWIENNALFGEDGLEGIIKYVQSKNLMFGIWFEIESCTYNAKISQKDETWFLHQDNERVYEKGRYYLDIRRKEVRDHLIRVVKRLYDKGVRYIKNDYNASLFGCDSDRGGKIFGLEEYQTSVSLLYKEIKDNCPGIIIENCGSGAMRSDNFILENADLQSFSDCENYRKYPNIINGSLVNVLPEKLGIWTVCYPQRDFLHFENFPSEEYIESMKDGEETIYNMVSSFFGQLYLSGRIDKADNLNIDLVKKAIILHRQYDSLINNSHLVIEHLPNRFENTQGTITLKITDGNKSLLGVWHLEGEEKEFVVKGKNIKMIYPLNKQFNNVSQTNKDTLTICFTKNYQARLFELDE